MYGIHMKINQFSEVGNGVPPLAPSAHTNVGNTNKHTLTWHFRESKLNLIISNYFCKYDHRCFRKRL